MKKWGIGCLLLTLVACQTSTQDVVPKFRYVGHSKAMKRAYNLPFQYDVLATEITHYFENIENDSVLNYAGFLRDYYALQDFQPHWISIVDTLSHERFLQVLSLAEMHGLNRKTYHYEQLETHLENLVFFYFQTGEVNYQLWAESEILLADGLLSLAKHLQHGVYNPLTDKHYHYYIPTTDTVFDTLGIFTAENLTSYMQTLIPTNRHYRALQKEFAKRLESPANSTTSEDYDTLNTLRANLERWRWNDLFTDTNFIVYVNLPAFEMRVLKADSTLMSSRICVGAKRPKNYDELYEKFLKRPKTVHRPPLHETPILKSAINQLVLNPQWYVPDNIGKFEILRHIRRDSNYLEKMEYQVYRGKAEIDPTTVDWAAVSDFDFPYRFVQATGDLNALGKMKFLFPNHFSVYLHDTPSKGAFSRKNRAVSHGCVRVENYLKLACILLNDMPKYDLKFIKKTIGLEKKSRNPDEKLKTKTLYLKTPVSVIIDYKTAWIDESGALQLFPDVYERDKLILEAL